MNPYICLIIAMLVPLTAGAHQGESLQPHDLWSAWSFEPGAVAALLLAAILYVRGLRRLWRDSAIGRGIRAWEAWCFAGGWIMLVVALVSPVHSLGSVLFAAHMTQHEILMVLAAPLLVLGRPLIPFLWGLPMSWRRWLGGIGTTGVVRRSWGALTRPIAAWSIHAAALWGWHAPGLFQATLTNELVHTLQHASFLGSALLFYWAIFQRGEERMGYGGAVLYLFTTAVHSSVLGALITFSPSPWYPAYAQTTTSWGFTPLEDQQLGGLIMWVPAGIIYLIGGLALFAAWLREGAGEKVGMKDVIPESGSAD